MAQEFQVSGQKIRFDREATVALYRETVTVAGANECTCTYCRNFAAHRDKAYPEEFLHLLERLGVNPLRELEAFELGSASDDPQSSLYGGWFVFCGELIEGVEQLRGVEEPAAFAYCFITSFPSSSDGKLCAVYFITRIPWTIGEFE